MWISIEVSPLIWVLAIHDIIPNKLYQNNLEVLINIQVPTFQFGIFKLESQVGDLRISIKKKNIQEIILHSEVWKPVNKTYISVCGTDTTNCKALTSTKRKGSEGEASVLKICCKRKTENRKMIRSRNYFCFFFFCLN